MEVFDIRAPNKPVALLSGHCPAAVARTQGIYKPIFVSRGRQILVSAGGSHDVTLFDAQDFTKGPTIISRGHLGYETTNLAVCPQSGKVAVAHGKLVSFLN